MKCKECKKETSYEIREVRVSIRDTTRDMAVEIVADDICLDCLLKAFKMEKGDKNENN